MKKTYDKIKEIMMKQGFSIMPMSDTKFTAMNFEKVKSYSVEILAPNKADIQSLEMTEVEE